MLENHSHPVIRHRQVPVKQSPSSIIPVPVEESYPDTMVVGDNIPIIVPSPIPPVVIQKPRMESVASIPSIDVAPLVTCIITNFKTKGLVRTALTTFVDAYPRVDVFLIDNGSGDSSTEYITKAGEHYESVTALLYDRNLGHGPAMNEAIHQSSTRYVFTMDSDCEVKRPGFLEEMVRHFQSDPNLYALGWLRYVDPYTGVPANADQGFLPYVHPHAALYDRQKYLTLSPFSHHGAPCTSNMREARERGYKVASFPIGDYVRHLVAGTRRMYHGRWDPRTGEEPKSWKRGREWPI